MKCEAKDCWLCNATRPGSPMMHHHWGGERSEVRVAANRRYGKAQIVAQERALRAEGGLCCTHPPDEHTILRSRS